MRTDGQGGHEDSRRGLPRSAAVRPGADIVKATHSLAMLALPLIALSVTASDAAKPKAGACTLVYAGTQGAEAGQGVYVATLDPRSGNLSPAKVAAEAMRPFWLLADSGRSILHVAAGSGPGGTGPSNVLSFAVDRATGKLNPIGAQASGGSGATHLAIDRTSQTLFVAHFGSATVAAMPIRADGTPAAPSSVQQQSGSGPSPRQASAHAHAVILDPSRRFLLVPDLGADRIFIYRFDAAKRQIAPNDPAAEILPAGSGPRHLVFDPSGRFAFLLSELSSEVRSYRWDAKAGRLSLSQTLFTGRPGSKAPPNSGSEIAISPDGRRLYVSTRGEDSITVYAVDRKTGALAEAQRIAAGGLKPWAFAFDPSGRWLVVANQGSDALTLFAVDPKTGLLSATAQSATMPKPVSVAMMTGAACP